MSFANSLRKLSAYIAAIKTQIGAGLAAAIRPAIVALNTLMARLLKAAQAFAAFMKTLFPFKNGASGLALGDAAAYTEDLSDSADSAADGLGDADDAAKKLKKDLSVLPFDELNQLNKDKEIASSNSGSGSGGGGGIDFGLGEGLFDLAIDETKRELTDLEKFVSEWAEKIKDAFDRKNWKDLGGAIAWGLNRGIDKLYDILDPKDVAKKINPYIDAFTQTFNSLTKNIHWNTLGRDIGKGINILVNATNRLIDPRTGIDWRSLGQELADGANGLIDEIDFSELGRMFGNKFMIFWNTAQGFAEDFNWIGLGIKLGEGINGLNDGIKWDTVADALSTSLNGAFESLREFTLTVDWTALVDNIASGINKFIKKFEWKKNGRALGSFLESLADALVDLVESISWRELGEGIATALSQIKWLELLKKVASAIIEALSGLIEGLIKDPEGAFVVAFGVGLAAVKLGSAVDKLTGSFKTYITGEKSVGVIQGAFQSLFSNGLKNISPALGPIAVAVAGIAASIAIADSNMRADLPKISKQVTDLHDSVKETIAKSNELNNGIGDSISQAELNAQANQRVAHPLLETLKSLASKTGELTEAEKTQKNDAIQGLINIYPELNGQISTQDTNLGKVVKTIEDYIQNTLEMAKTEVIYEKLKEETRNLMDIENKRKQLGEKIEELNKRQNARYEEQTPLIEAVEKETGKHAATLDELVRYLDEVSTSQLTVNGETKAGSEWATEIANELDREKQSARDLAEEQRTLGGDLNALNVEYANSLKNTEALQNDLQALTRDSEATSASISTLADEAEKIPGNITTGVVRTQGMPSAIIKQMSSDMIAKLSAKDNGNKSGYEETAKEIPSDAASGIAANANVAVDAVGDMADDMHDKFDEKNGTNAFSGVYLVSSKEIPQDVASGIEKNQHLAVEAVRALCSSMQEKFNEKLGDNGLGGMLEKRGFSLIGKLISGMNNKLNPLGNKVGEVYNKVSDLVKKISDLSNSFYNAGQTIAQSLANGISSVQITVPHVVWDGSYTRMYTGPDTWSEIPNYTVRWYKRGGLFTKATLAGFGEAGDEAALPLENSRVMNRIANAIIDNSGGGLGISKQDIVDAVVYAMAANANNQPPINVTATLYTEDNEVLARSVERGQRSRNMRFNPTTAY